MSRKPQPPPRAKSALDDDDELLSEPSPLDDLVRDMQPLDDPFAGAEFSDALKPMADAAERMMPAASTLRVRAFRRREKEGRELVPTNPPTRLIEDLVEAGMLDRRDRDNKAKIAEAIDRLYDLIRLDLIAMARGVR